MEPEAGSTSSGMCVKPVVPEFFINSMMLGFALTVTPDATGVVAISVCAKPVWHAKSSNALENTLCVNKRIFLSDVSITFSPTPVKTSMLATMNFNAT
ncbi:MAG: hypothetical protein ING75_07430 [Rhodocyclaceae bacterium]|nr:hypothetical protein [Rhodocyclaceae bacterium]